jgi:hypothetical protein
LASGLYRTYGKIEAVFLRLIGIFEFPSRWECVGGDPPGGCGISVNQDVVERIRRQAEGGIGGFGARKFALAQSDYWREIANTTLIFGERCFAAFQCAACAAQTA